MKKTFRKQQEETQIIWANMSHDPAFNPNKLIKYYAVIKVGEKSYLTEYEAKQRSEAVAIFTEEARLSNGKVELIRTYK